MASASAVECTATVAMPSSLQARSTRSAISPRLAIRILSNIAAPVVDELLFDDDQRLAEFDRLAVLDQDLRHGAGARRRIWFIVFIASMISSVSPAFTPEPTSMNGLAPGSAAR